MLRRRFFLSAVAVTVLLALAASVAVTRPLRAGGKRIGSVPTSLLDHTIPIIVIVGGLALLASVSWLGLGMDRRDHPQSFAKRVLRAIAIVAVVVAVIVLVLRHVVHGAIGKHGNPTGMFSAASRDVSFHWPWLLAIAGVGGLLALLVFTARQRSAGSSESRRAQSLAGAISQSLDDLRADPDLRRAIVAAYARMETALAATGVPRDPAEAPNEYLERALLSVDASAGSARRLTELFERARFSHHEPDARMRDDAIDALVAVRDELRGGAVAA
jgi:hypothetical protein